MKDLAWTLMALLVLTTPVAFAQDDEASDSAAAETEQPDAVEEPAAPQDPGGPKTLSGMSILGNEEAPKSLVIVPWKSSELGDNITLSDTLDDRARPVDKDVFVRELRFYEIRSGE